jgi:hypothetical protein
MTEIVLGASSTLGPTFITESFETENVQSEGADVNTDNEDSLEQVLEGLSPGHLDTDSTIPGHIHNGLSNPDESPDDTNIIDDSNLGQFTLAL